MKVGKIVGKLFAFYRSKMNGYKEIKKAAHERTDIEVTDEMRKYDDDIMSDDDF